MIVIRRMVDQKRAYTAIFLKGEPARIIATTEQEHARILQIYKQDRRYEGILNDFTDFGIGKAEGVETAGGAVAGGVATSADVSTITAIQAWVPRSPPIPALPAPALKVPALPAPAPPAIASAAAASAAAVPAAPALPAAFVHASATPVPGSTPPC